MNLTKSSFAAALVAAVLPMSAVAQDAEFKLPEQCAASTGMGGMDHSAMDAGGMDSNMMEMMGMAGGDLAAMPEHVQENMRRMMITMPAMHAGMMNEDADVAFACGMIAHHQGAIDMAQVLLANGEDPAMRALAEGIIAAQVGEIEQMTKWLGENSN